MTSLSDVYEGEVGGVAGPRQRFFGTTLFAVGVAMVVGAIPIATTELGASLGLELYDARIVAGVLAGLGLPAAFVGFFIVLPAGRATRAAAAIGASLALFGVTLFAYAYPYRWLSNDPALAVGTTLLYSLGTLTTFWCLFVAVATLKTRNDPGGTARMHVTEAGTVRIVEENSRIPGFGSIGLFGNDPVTEVAKEPARVSGRSVAGSTDGSGGAEVLGESSPPASDGGTAVAESDGNEAVLEAAAERGRPDEYCGNCAHFEYVGAGDDLVPYCEFHDERMDDMDACDEWDANS